MTQDQSSDIAELAGGFIHEIKNHLGTLGLNLQLLAEDFQDPQNQRERRALARVQKLQGECQRLVEVSNDFLRFARLKDFKRVPTDLGRMIEELLDFFLPTAKSSNIDIKTFIPSDLPPVALDRDLFQQALLNLMLNAQQAMPKGGAITLQANVESSDPPHVCLSIIDTGPGMDAEVLSKIFRPFFSTKKGGSGLGLPTVKRIVEGHQGTLDVQSEVGKGTKIALHLPIARFSSQADSSV